MNKKITITKIHKDTVQTQYGLKDKIGIKGEDGVWYTCFYKKACASWKVGDVLDLEVEKKGDFHNIILPKEGGFDQGQLKRIEEKLDKVLLLLDPKGDMVDKLSEDAPF